MNLALPVSVAAVNIGVTLAAPAELAFACTGYTRRGSPVPNVTPRQEVTTLTRPRDAR
jgi:hypothetical protein